MKAININTNVGLAVVDLSDKQPCWYAILEDRSPRSKAKWVIGVKRSAGKDEEYSFKISKAIDVTDDGFWNYASSVDFAINLIDKYKNIGKSEVIKWVEDGCPGFVKRSK